MFCSKCGAPLEANISFCPKCGAPTSAQPAAPAAALPPGATYTAQPAVVVNVATPVFTCPFCHFQGPPIVERKLSSNGWVVFVLLLVFCLPLCWLPFVIDGCKEDTRKCPSCGMRLS
jgi:hypothetical protein